MARQHGAEKRLSGSAANALRALHRRFRHALPHHPARGPRHDAEPANRTASVSARSLTAEQLAAVESLDVTVRRRRLPAPRQLQPRLEPALVLVPSRDSQLGSTWASPPGVTAEIRFVARWSCSE